MFENHLKMSHPEKIAVHIICKLNLARKNSNVNFEFVNKYSILKNSLFWRQNSNKIKMIKNKTEN